MFIASKTDAASTRKGLIQNRLPKEAKLWLQQNLDTVLSARHPVTLHLISQITVHGTLNPWCAIPEVNDGRSHRDT
jgi:hypothetical protein